VLLVGDLPAIAAILPARLFRSEDARDGRNRALLEEPPAGDGELARWMRSRLQR
jgi:hypothetical protein